jgi:hypothetical protein
LKPLSSILVCINGRTRYWQCQLSSLLIELWGGVKKGLSLLWNRQDTLSR